MGEGVPEAVLNSGEKIPMIGLGTASSPVPQDLLISSFISAIETGYRHFDTAALYGSEAPLGKAIAQALQQGLVKSRDELFITSKLWCTEAHHDRVLPALKQTLQNLELDYIDLYLIHWPMSLKPGENKFPFNKEDLLPMDFKAVWEAMEECQRLGLVKSIGVSNFSWKKLSQLMVNAKIPPAVNQVELNPAWQQRKLRDFCKENGILVSAWSPLGAFGASWGSLAVMDSPILKEIAAAKGKSTAQVSLRWIYQQGVSVIVKSFNKERMKENLGIFDWELSEEELQQISQIPQHRGFSGEPFISPNGPYKTLQELWDEDS
ncbi:methylecgonone reductase-like protein [Cinnamomum micranthum f. kanehirae]|uniref:Methylecgonone reductase-like protein n=1 Tax=Cinnamomum micranthum f. kanehirae TaxID=337451 RepID=A0A3S3M8H9_9MAGN|nr:methylecgonone reductase-like protein [Cinnamomum micranthum f. kanehirae]